MGDSFDFDFAVTAPFRMQPGLRRCAGEGIQAPLLGWAIVDGAGGTVPWLTVCLPSF